MKKLLLAFGFIFFLITGLFAQHKWKIDQTHSTVEFEVSHLTVSSVTGFFTSFNGSVNSPNDNNFDGAQIDATIDVSSVNTNNLERDRHLKEDDFFNAEKYPSITFKSTTFKKNAEGDYLLMGNLTIRDVTKTVELEVDFGGIVTLQSGARAGLTASGMINRFDYGLKWDDSLDSGGLIVGEKVDITLKIELVKE